MKKFIKNILALLASSFIFLFTAGQSTAKSLTALFPDSSKRTAITLLGVYHFANPNLDQFNVASDNVLSPRRQAELEALAKELARFKPTRIALEYDRNKSNADKLYAKYLAGEYTLGENEAEQIGFRLAKLLGHPHIYPADERNIELNFEPKALATEFEPLLQQLSIYGENVIGQINGWVKEYTIGEVLRRLNSDELDKLNIDLYYRFLLPIGKGDQQPGAEAVARWYKRNLYIFHHIKEIAGTEGKERVLVIMGQGHTAMLKQFLQYSTEFKVEDIRQYLPE